LRGGWERDGEGGGGKGRELMQRAQFVRMLPQEVPLPVLPGND